MELKQKLFDLQQQLQAQHEVSKKFVADGEFGDSYKASEAKCDELESQIAAVKALIAREDGLETPAGDLSKGMKGAAASGDAPFASGILKGLRPSVVKAFAADVRKAMNEGTGSAGGYTVPVDIVTRIYALIEQEESFADFVTTEIVRTNSGARTYKTRAQHTGFSAVNEGAKILKTDGPTFGRVEYTCTKKGGILPVTNELLEDSDENLVAVIVEWMAAEARATINSNVVTLAEDDDDPAAITSIDDILAVLTVGLGSAIRNISTIHTNDSGLQWLLTQKDNNGRSLLVPNPTEPKQMQLSVGAVTVPVKVWSNDVLPNAASTDAIPFIIGSLKEGVFRFDRRELTLRQTDVGSVTVSGTVINAFESDMTLFRGTLRDDYKIRDAAAFKFAQVTPDP